VSVPHGLPVEVLDCAEVLDIVGLALEVRDCVEDPLTVLEEVTVFVDVTLPVFVFEVIEDRVARGLAVAVFVSAAVRVNTTVGLIVTDGNWVGVSTLEALAEYVDVVVFVDVLDIVPVAVGTIPRLRSILNSSKPGGVAATRPIDNKIINHFMPI
jgi:hypothetical protein